MDTYDIQKLLYRWMLRRISYAEQAKATEDVERLKTLASMDFQLLKCIEELEEVIKGEEESLARRLLEAIQRVQE